MSLTGLIGYFEFGIYLILILILLLRIFVGLMGVLGCSVCVYVCSAVACVSGLMLPVGLGCAEVWFGGLLIVALVLDLLFVLFFRFIGYFIIIYYFLFVFYYFDLFGLRVFGALGWVVLGG